VPGSMPMILYFTEGFKCGNPVLRKPLLSAETERRGV